MALTVGPVTVITGQYFERRQGLALTLLQSGGSFGGILLPFLLQYFLEAYGLHGTLLLSGGLMFQLAVLGMLMKPLHLFQRQSSPEKEKMLRMEKREKENLDDHSYISDVELRTVIAMSYCSINHVVTPLSSQRSVYDRTQIGISSKSISSTAKSFRDVGRTKVIVVHSGSDLNIENTNPTILNECMCLMRNKRFLTMSLASLLLTPGCFLIGVYIPPHAEKNGLRDSDLFLITSIMGGTDLFGRVSSSFLADSHWISNHNMIAISTIVTGISSMFVTFYVDLSSIVVYTCIFGIFGGIYFALFAPVLIEFVGMELFPTALGLSTLLHGISVSASMPILGEYTTLFILVTNKH